MIQLTYVLNEIFYRSVLESATPASPPMSPKPSLAANVSNTISQVSTSAKKEEKDPQVSCLCHIAVAVTVAVTIFVCASVSPKQITSMPWDEDSIKITWFTLLHILGTLAPLSRSLSRSSRQAT